MKSEENSMNGTATTTGSSSQEARQRWTAPRKREVVLRIMRGESMDALSREIGVEIYRLEEWHGKVLQGLDHSLTKRRSDPRQVELDEAMKRVGELTMENELLHRKVELLENKRPLARRRSRR
ncbi:MAG: IS3 family transposase [Magnetococcales bacterium]|nr:IS3 family transposase [Magnetococcales bacterium]MBF0447218.1 IS3 family transposase [Magnetococcales bacterium]